MGQYYKCINLDKQEMLVPWSYDNGAKLMEHSWIGNNLLAAATGLLADKWKGDRIVWAGDYGDKGLYLDNLEPSTFISEYDGETYQYNLYSYASEYFKEIEPQFAEYNVNEEYPFIVNHDLEEYVDMRSLPDDDGWVIHPLSLLTCSGNGRGGGDFRGNNPYVESWSGHQISVESEAPEGFKEIHPDFKE